MNAALFNQSAPVSSLAICNRIAFIGYRHCYYCLQLTKHCHGANSCM